MRLVKLTEVYSEEYYEPGAERAYGLNKRWRHAFRDVWVNLDRVNVLRVSIASQPKEGFIAQTTTIEMRDDLLSVKETPAEIEAIGLQKDNA